MAKTTVDLPEEVHRKLRVLAALENRSMQDIVLTALSGYLTTFRLSPELLEVETVPRREEPEQPSSRSDVSEAVTGGARS